MLFREHSKERKEGELILSPPQNQTNILAHKILAQLMTSVKDAPEVTAVFAESVPVNVMVYVPVGGQSASA